MRQITPSPGLFRCALWMAGCLALSGCHSAFVQATVVNSTAGPIRLFEVDYPSASFGSGELPAGGQFHYRFKIVGSGPAKVSWTDGAGKEHTANGPAMHDGEEGTLRVELGSETAAWKADLHTAP